MAVAKKKSTGKKASKVVQRKSADPFRFRVLASIAESLSDACHYGETLKISEVAGAVKLLEYNLRLYAEKYGEPLLPYKELSHADMIYKKPPTPVGAW